MGIIQRITAKLEKKCYKIPLLFQIYSRPYKGIIRREVDLAKMTSKDLVVNVGCGSVPYTAIYIAQMTGAKVLAVDIDPDAVQSARECIKRLGLEKEIEVIQGDGSNLPLRPFTAAIIALQAAPKKEILTNLISKSKESVRLIFRQPRAIFKSQYDYLTDEYKPVAYAEHKIVPFDKSLLFIAN